MHKIGVDVHLLQGLCLHQKAPAMSTSIAGFCTTSTIGGCLLQFCPFCPQSVVPAAQYRCQSVILNTHRDKPAQLWNTLCAPSEKQQLQDLRGWRRGGRAVVNCESKTINRVSRRSGAWCMDELLLLLEQKHINWIACLSPGRHYTH